MLVIGLTGSIATGKSTVSSILSQPPYTLPVIDADVLARKAVEPGTSGYYQIVSHFGPTTADLLSHSNDSTSDPPLNRAALGRRVFGNSEEMKKDRKVLNGIVHPAVRRQMYRQLLSCYVRGCWAVVLDVPLLFESQLDILCGAVVVVAVRNPETQMERLRQRDPHLSVEEAENRVRSQTDVRDKVRRCEARGRGSGIVIWNDNGREELDVELAKAMEELRRASPPWWSWFLLLSPLVAGLAGLCCCLRSIAMRRRWEAEEIQAKAKL